MSPNLLFFEFYFDIPFFNDLYEYFFQQVVVVYLLLGSECFLVSEVVRLCVFLVSVFSAFVLKSGISDIFYKSTEYFLKW
jgi:hypothetical protein